MSINNYLYENKLNIDSHLICKKCCEPFVNPVSLPFPCDETYCLECIQPNLQNHSNNCQECHKKSLTNEDLRSEGTIIQKMLNELLVQCNLCNQHNIQRNQLEKHLEEVCLKRKVFCTGKDIQCPWNGYYDQLYQHLKQCPYEQIRPLLMQLIQENQRLEELGQLKRDFVEVENKYKDQRIMNEQISNENINLKDQLSVMREIYNENESLNESLKKHLSEINKLEEENQCIQLLENQINQFEQINENYQRDILLIEQLSNANKSLRENLQKFILVGDQFQILLQENEKQKIKIKELLNDKKHLKQISNRIEKQRILLKQKFKRKSNLSKHFNKENQFVKQQSIQYQLQIKQQTIQHQIQIDGQTTQHQIQTNQLDDNHQRKRNEQTNRHQSQIKQISEEYQQQIEQLNINIQKLNAKLYKPIIISQNCIEESDHWNEELEEVIDLCKKSCLLNLNGLKVNDKDIELVLNKGLINKQCQSLILWNNGLTTHSISKLSSILNLNKSLTKLSIVNNCLNDQSIEYLSSSLLLSNCTLKQLILGSNQITDQGLIHLSNMLKRNETLIVLGLQNNQITDRGIEYLSGIKNDFIEQISLYSNKLITDDSCNYITNIIQNNKSLNQFWIWDCQLSKRGINQLIQSIQTKINFQLLL